MDQMMAEIARQERQFGQQQETTRRGQDITARGVTADEAANTIKLNQIGQEAADRERGYRELQRPAPAPNAGLPQYLAANPLAGMAQPQQPEPEIDPAKLLHGLTLMGIKPTADVQGLAALLPVREKWGANIDFTKGRTAGAYAGARLTGERAQTETETRPGKVATGLANADLAKARTTFLREQTKWLTPKMKSQIDRDAARAAYDMKRTSAVDEQMALSRYRAQAYAANVNSLVEYRKKGGVVGPDDIIKLKLSALSNLRIADAQIAALVGRGDATDEDIAQLETDANEIRDLYGEVQGLESGTPAPTSGTATWGGTGGPTPPPTPKASLTAGKSWGTNFSKLPPKFRTWAQKKRGEKKSDTWIAEQLKAAGVAW